MTLFFVNDVQVKTSWKVGTLVQEVNI